MILVLFFCGCLVPRSHLDALQMELDATRAELTTKNEAVERENKTLQASLEAAQAELEALRGEGKSLSERLSVAEKNNQDLVSEKAGLLSDKAKSKASIEEMKAALLDLQARQAEAEKRVAEYRDLLSRFQALIDAGKLKVKIVGGRMVVELSTDVLFASGSAELSPEGKAAVAEVGKVLAEIPGKRFQVEGHTDDVPIKTATYPSNWELASARAVTVVRTLDEAGLQPGNVSAASFGQWQPVASNKTPEGRAANRRIEIVVVPDLSGLPGFEELKQAAQGSTTDGKTTDGKTADGKTTEGKAAGGK